MPDPIVRLTLEQFRLLMPNDRVLERRLDAVHVHHTWRPTRAQFRGLHTIEAMRRVHMEQGWSDIAQHLTIDPLGGLWTGRNWNQMPASTKGHNGTADQGPFMFEMVGDFDTGRDSFDGPQRDAAFEVIAHVLHIYGLQLSDIKLHRELNGNLKTCPGSGITRSAIEDGVRKVLKRLAKPTTPSAPLFAREHLAGFAMTRSIGRQNADARTRDATVPEHPLVARGLERSVSASVAADLRRTRVSRDLSGLIADEGDRGEDWSALKPYVVNLSRGVLSEGGAMSTSPADLQHIIDAIDDAAAATPGLRVMLHAHGGLVSESSALGYARTMYEWWLRHGIYPVFFIWESDVLEILRQYVVGPRDVWDWTTDPAIELAAKPAGTLAWSGMKDSARRASAEDLGEGYPGGAFLFASLLGSLMQRRSDIELHAVGHSAGAIFLSHLLPALLRKGAPKIHSLSLLAPACRTELFKDQLLPLIENRTIDRHCLFTMEDEAERQDNCFNAYHKSLLYLVSESFEGLAKRPILGLERSLRKDQVLSRFYGLGLQPASAGVEVQFSTARDKAENPLTRAVHHGDFDNDRKTMSSVLRRILAVSDASHLGEATFPGGDVDRSFTFEPQRDTGRGPMRATRPASAHSAAVQTSSRRGGRRVALCVGIDRYREKPLAGCVNDARTWGTALSRVGFEVQYLLDQQASRDALVDQLRSMVGEARPGDVLAFQYSGHGTQLPDDNGDEGDGFDEAIVPVDYDTGALFLRDDLVADVLTAVPEGVLLTLFMDCCHCGTISRFAPAVRAIETTNDRIRYLEVAPDLVRAARSFRRRWRPARSPVETSLPGVVHLAACRDNELAWESNGQGDFTAVATRLLNAALERGDSNEAFIAAVAREVARKGRQQPMLMPLGANLSGRPLLAGSATATTAASPSAVASADADAMLRHLEAAVSILRGQAMP